MSKKAHSGSHAGGKYGGLRVLHKATLAGRQMRTNPANAASLMKAVQRSETKLAMKNAGWVDYASGSLSLVSTGGHVQPIALVEQGSTANQRVGGKIKWKSIQIRGSVYAGATADLPQNGTVLFVYDRYPGATKPTVAEILKTDSSNSMLNDGNRNRFVIVRRLDFQFGPVQLNYPDSGYFFVDEYVKLKGLPAEYVGTGTATGDYGDIRVGALLIVATGELPYTAGKSPQAVLNIRTRFADVQG